MKANINNLHCFKNNQNKNQKNPDCCVTVALFLDKLSPM